MRNALATRLLVALLAAAVTSAAFGAEKAPAAKAAAARPAPAEKGEAVAYDDLRLHVGQKVIVHTRYKSTRTGMLMKFSQVELTLSIDTPDGASELTIPKDTVASVLVVTPPPAPAK